MISNFIKHIVSPVDRQSGKKSTLYYTRGRSCYTALPSSVTSRYRVTLLSRVTLRDLSLTKTKTLSGGARWLFLAQPRLRGLRSRGISEHLPVSAGPGRVHPGGCRCGQPHPHTPNKGLYVPYQGSEAADLTSNSTIINLLPNRSMLRALYIILFTFLFPCGIASLSFSFFS